MSGGGFGSAPSGPTAATYWATINPAHAIQRASAIITFSEEVSSFVVSRMVDAVRATARSMGLIKEEPVNVFMMQIGPGGMANKSPSSHSGTSFQNVVGSNMVQNLTITKDAMKFDTFSYTRWVAFREQLAVILQEVLPIVEQTARISSIALEYVDFFFSKIEGSADVSAVIERKSDMLVKHAFQRRLPFHSHSGWLEGADGAPSRRLINVDLTVNDATGPVGVRRAITLRTHEAEQLTDTASSRAQEMVQVEPMLVTLDALHLNLKKRLGAILTREASAMISLAA